MLSVVVGTLIEFTKPKGGMSARSLKQREMHYSSIVRILKLACGETHNISFPTLCKGTLWTSWISAAPIGRIDPNLPIQTIIS